MYANRGNYITFNKPLIVAGTRYKNSCYLGEWK